MERVQAMTRTAMMTIRRSRSIQPLSSDHHYQDQAAERRVTRARSPYASAVAANPKRCPKGAARRGMRRHSRGYTRKLADLDARTIVWGLVDQKMDK